RPPRSGMLFCPVEPLFQIVHILIVQPVLKLVVAGSGHIAGVVNPPSANKYQYWLNDEDVDNLEEWLDRAEEHAGSWWPHWAKWTAQHSGKKVKARKPGDGKLKPLEDAPGSYVKVRS
ncbi:MAG: hypothetical protein AAGF86_06350, partial [Pseudomonadota bacterium]